MNIIFFDFFIFFDFKPSTCGFPKMYDNICCVIPIFIPFYSYLFIFFIFYPFCFVVIFVYLIIIGVIRGSKLLWFTVISPPAVFLGFPIGKPFYYFG